MKKVIFLMGGRTGGPLTPLIAIASQLPYTPIVVGVSGGYEEKYAIHNEKTFLSLPQTKLSSLSFSGGFFSLLIEVPIQLLVLVFSYFKCLIYVVKYKPAAILGAGGFSAVPMVFAVKTLSFFGLKTRIIIHQQDPKVGLTNKIILRFADYGSYVYDYEPDSRYIKGLRKIPNPIEFEKFNSDVIEKDLQRFPLLSKFLSRNDKPTLLIFGGGSGAKVINNWVIDNVASLTKKFKVIHLTGVLQTNDLPNINDTDYFRMEFAFEEMPLLLTQSDVIICRAGLGSISELIYLQKDAVLIPIPNSHQIINAEVVSDYFEIWKQSEIETWIDNLSTGFPQVFHNKRKNNSEKYRNQLCKYYEFLDTELDGTEK